MAGVVCVICRDLVVGPGVRVDQESCVNHVIHENCITNWASASRRQRNIDGFSCPTCRGLADHLVEGIVNQDDVGTIPAHSGVRPVPPELSTSVSSLHGQPSPSILETAVDAALDEVLGFLNDVTRDVLEGSLRAGLSAALSQMPSASTREHGQGPGNLGNRQTDGTAGQSRRPTPYSTTCQICHQEFKSRAAKSQNMSTHKSPWTCPICNTTIRQASNVKRHQCTHDQ